MAMTKLLNQKWTGRLLKHYNSTEHDSPVPWLKGGEFARFGIEIVVVDNTKKTENEELVEDLIQIVIVFSARLQGKRAHKAKKMIEELKSDDSDKEN